jgi:hypothetical protein
MTHWRVTKKHLSTLIYIINRRKSWQVCTLWHHKHLLLMTAQRTFTQAQIDALLGTIE